MLTCQSRVLRGSAMRFMLNAPADYVLYQVRTVYSSSTLYLAPGFSLEC